MANGMSMFIGGLFALAPLLPCRTLDPISCRRIGPRPLYPRAPHHDPDFKYHLLQYLRNDAQTLYSHFPIIHGSS